MDFLITTTLTNLKEVNTLVIGKTRENMDNLFVELMNKYEVFSFVFSEISPDEKRMIREGVKYSNFQFETLIDLLKPYERTETDSRTFSKASPKVDSGEMAQGN